MKSLIQILESLRILFIRSNLQTRTALVLCTLLLGVGVGLLVQNANVFSSRLEFLLDGQDFTPGQLDQFELAFSNAALRNYQRMGNRMRIPTASKDAYLKALAQAKCLPIHTQQISDSASDPLRLFEPRTASLERERKERIRQIENTLKEFPFVRQAVVTYDEKTDGFALEKKRAATVAIHPKNKNHLSRPERRSIIRLVHMHFPGLKASEVVLVDLGLGETFTEPNLDSDLAGHLVQSDIHWIDRRREHEAEIKKKALELLAGYGDVQIVVTSEPIESQTSSELQNANETQSQSQLPSTIPNRKARLEDLVASRGILNSLPTYTNRISVSIPMSYYQRAYRHHWQTSQADPDHSVGASMSAVASNMPAATDNALAQIKTQTMQAVREKLAPLVTGQNNQIENRVAVTDYIDSVDSTLSPTDPWTHITHWLVDSWKTLGLFALVLIAMLMLRSVAGFRDSKESKDNRHRVGDAEKQASGASLIDLKEASLENDQDEPLAKSSVILTKKVQSQPEQVALRLATWISQN
ncbi:MAG: hypothetical protein RLZZ396_2812 [Planctomycetota bacterium]